MGSSVRDSSNLWLTQAEVCGGYSNKCSTIMQIYLFRNGSTEGPYNLAEIRALIEEGQIDLANTLGWYDKHTDWLPLSEVLDKLSRPPEIPPFDQPVECKQSSTFQKLVTKINNSPNVIKVKTWFCEMDKRKGFVTALGVFAIVIIISKRGDDDDSNESNKSGGSRLQAKDFVLPVYIQSNPNQHHYYNELQQRNQRLEFEMQQQKFAQGLRDAMAKSDRRNNQSQPPSGFLPAGKSQSEIELERERRRLRDAMARDASPTELDMIESSIKGLEWSIEFERQYRSSRGL